MSAPRCTVAVVFWFTLIAAGATALPEKAPASRPAGGAVPATGCVDCHLALDDSRITPPAKAFTTDDVHA